MLRQFGFEVQEAANGAEALVKVEEKPDVVLLDVNMPTLAGDQIAKILVRVLKTPETMVLLYSSMPLDSLRLKAIATGAHGYIQKTENTNELVRRIEYWLNRGRPATSSSRIEAVASANYAPPNLGAQAPTSSSSMRAAKRAGEPGSGRHTGLRILFVDDDWSMLNTYRTIVAGQMEAEYVMTGEEAFNRILSDSPPHLVVCDILMPGLSGADLYRRAVTLDSSWSRRFLFVTGAASSRTVAEFINELDVRVFHKPVAPERLLETVRQLADRWC